MDLDLRLLNHKAGLNLEFLNRRATKPIREGTQMEYYSIGTRSVFPKVQDWGSSYPIWTLEVSFCGACWSWNFLDNKGF